MCTQIVQEVEIWLDLEETIINNWDDAWLTHHVPKIKAWLDYHKPTKINIWSFAIWSEEDRDYFVNSGMKEVISNELGYRISKYPSMLDMMKWAKEYDGIHYENVHEFAQLNGKTWSFVKFGVLQQNKKLFLIDDAVPHLEMKVPDNNVSIYLLNVERDI